MAAPEMVAAGVRVLSENDLGDPANLASLIYAAMAAGRPLPPRYCEHDVARFWAKVHKGAPDECWLWAASVDEFGYGSFGLNRQTTKAHIVSYELANGSIGPGLCVCHSCDTPPCCNPRHLWLGTRVENMHDKMLKGRQKSGGMLGETNPSSILTAAAVQTIKARLTAGASLAAVAKQFGVSKSAIHRISNGTGWTHL